MKIKKIVKVMNFQTLLHINAAKKKAESYQNVGEEITEIIKKIMYNKNLMLDKKIVLPEKSKPKLSIYIANDYGFCGDFNSTIRSQIRKEKDDFKIIIGKKITGDQNNVIMRMAKGDFHTKLPEIEVIINNALNDLSYSEINLYYNHYYGMDRYEFRKIQLFPIEFPGKYYEGKDYVSETDSTKLLKGLISFYICYQIKIAETISIAAENVLRNQITHLALEKIKEKEKAELNERRKKQLEVTIKKNVENYKRMLEGE